MKIEPRTLKGFRDFLPKETKRRQYVLETLKKVFESYGFEPLETPALEYDEILSGKYGREGEKLMYRFEDNGQRKVAMRYDQTVPLARVVAQYANVFPMPFKRYQVQNVWRAENTQRGRYREFLQVDADIVGSYSPLADAEIIAVANSCLQKLGFKKFRFIVNDRSTFLNLMDNQSIQDNELPAIIRALDKLKKIGEEKVTEELTSNGFTKDKAQQVLTKIKTQKPTTKILKIFSVLENLGLDKASLEFLPTLARGLDYYTGLIFEIEVDGYNAGSVAGGGRYDNLIGMFADRDIPAVGFSFGFDRLSEAMEELKLFPEDLFVSKVFVAFSDSELEEQALKLTNELRNKNISCETYLEDASLEKQLKYADKKNIPFVIIVEENSLILKDMQNRTQDTLPLEQILKKLQ